MTDRIVSVRGTVVKVSTVKPLVVQMSFECAKCSCKIIRNFTDGKFSPPTSCGMQGCKSKTFNPLRSTAQCIDFQKIRQALLLFNSSVNKSGSLYYSIIILIFF